MGMQIIAVAPPALPHLLAGDLVLAAVDHPGRPRPELPLHTAQSVPELRTGGFT